MAPQLKIDYNRAHMASAVSKYMSDRRAVGANPSGPVGNKRKANVAQRTDETRGMYSARYPMSKAGRNLDHEHTPADADGVKWMGFQGESSELSWSEIQLPP